MIKYFFGKTSKSLQKIKSNFIEDNSSHLKIQEKKGIIYKAQPLRKKCKACNNKLIGKYFISHKIKYILCKYCTHLNGANEDNIIFTKKIYFDQKKN